MKHRIKTLTPWLLLAPLLLFLSYGPANSAISTGSGVPITGAASTIATTDLTASRVLVSNSSGKVAVSTVTSTTLGYLDATSSIQTQINGKAASSHSHAASDITSGVLGATYGGTGNGFTAFTGPTTSTKTFTLPNASAVILTDNALVTAAQGGTGNGFTEFTGPTTIKKTFTLPNASATILTDNAAVTVAQGGTGATTLTPHGVLIGNATGTVAATSAGTAGQVLTSGGAGADPTWQNASGGSVNPGETNFRLSLSTGVPIMYSSVTAATSVYAVPYKGNRISLYSGSAWLSYSSAEMSLSLSGFTANKNYDIFCYDNAGTPTLEGLVWTDDTTRATALTAQDGVYVKSGAATRKYLGTIRIGSTGQSNFIYGAIAAGGTPANFGVWNNYNRVKIVSLTGDNVDSWTYNTASTWREAGGNTDTMKESFVVGLQEEPVRADYQVQCTTAGSSSNASVGIGLDSKTSPVAGQRNEFATVGATMVPLAAVYDSTVAVGYHYFAAIEYKLGSNAVTFFGDNSGSSTYEQSGLFLTLWM